MYNDIDIIVSTTLPTIDRLSTYKNGGDALILYFRYARQARLQKTNTTYSKDTFMAEGLQWSMNKFYKVKKILTDNGLIEVIVRKGDDGKIEGTYVQVNFLITALSKNHSMEKPESGKKDTNAGSNKNKNALNNKTKYKDKDYSKQEAIDLVYQEYRKQIPNDKLRFTKSADSKLQIEQVMKEFSLDDLMKAQNNYFKTQSPTYLMACQYFYSNKKGGKTYRPFIDYIGEEAIEEKKGINFEELF